MVSSAPSLNLLSLTAQTLRLSSSKPTTTSLFFFALPSSSLKLCLSSYSRSFATSFSSSTFVRNVSLSSQYDQLEEDEEMFGGDGVEPSFSSDLKLFVGNLSFRVDSAALAGLFGRSGNVEMVEVIYDKQTGRSRGFGFVTMSTAEEAEAAAQQFNGYELDGRAIRVNSGPPPRKETSSFVGGRGTLNFNSTNQLYVGNLAWGVDNLALESLFSKQGKVMEAKVVYDRDSGRSRGFGFVTYRTADEVKNAIESLDGVELNGRPIRVSIAEARPRRQF